MAGKFLQLDEAACLLGITPDDLKEMRSQNKIHGYRDGTTWKFKVDEVDRVLAKRADKPAEAAAEDELTMSTSPLEEGLEELVEVGEAEPTSGEAGDDEFELVSDEEELASVGAVEEPVKAEAADELELDLEDEAPKEEAGDDLALTDDDFELADDDELTLTDDADTGAAVETEAAEDEMDLVAESDGDDDLVLGGDDAAEGDDLELSEMSLEPEEAAGKEDLDLSLEEETPDAAAEVGDGDFLLQDEDGGEEAGEPTSDDDFLLTPFEESGADESESGSQVIALDADEEFGDPLAAGDGGVGVLEEEADLSEAVAKDIGEAEPELAVEGVAATAMSARVPEAAYSIWNIVSLGFVVVLLSLSGVMIVDLARNMWAWGGTYSLNRPIMDMIVGMMGG